MPSTLELQSPAGLRQRGDRSSRRRRLVQRPWLAAAVLTLLACAVAQRFAALDRVPGLNGDEAWYGAQALGWLAGEPIGWRTPTGNPLNPFFFLPLAALHAWWAPSIALLRIPALASGLLACALNYCLCRKVFDRTTAVVSTVLLAVLPINLAYSRFAWDASQSLLATVLVLYLAYWRPPGRGLIAGSAALVAAVLVHPTNVFAAPLAFAPWASEQLPNWLVRRGLHAGPWRQRLLIACCWSCGLAAVLAPARSVAFLLDYLRLLSGATVYRFISGTLPDVIEWPGLLDVDLFDVAALCVVGAGVIGFAKRLRQADEPMDRALAWGCGLSLAGFYLVAGPAALQPHYERYGIVLVAPSVLVLSRGTAWWLANLPRRSAAWCVAAVGWLLLGSYWLYYFRPIESSGGNAHLAFRTAGVEPKSAAVQKIRAEAAGQPAWIVADDWWLYWPLRYLTGKDPDLHVVHADELPAQLGESGTEHKPGQLWLVQFCAGSPAAAEARLERRYGEAERQVLCDGQGRPLLNLTRLRLVGDL